METLLEKTSQKVVMKTESLQDLVGRAVKACSFVTGLPVTELIEFSTDDHKVIIKTTDNVNILVLEKTMDDVFGGFQFVVNAKLFSSLVAKLTTPLTELSVEDNQLIVKANGKYELPLVTEQDGSAVHLPSFDFNTDVSSNSITLNELRSILTMNKACKSEMKETPSNFNYYVDSKNVLTTDTFKACCNPIKLLDNPACLPPNLVELMSLVADESGITIQENDQSILCTSSTGMLFGRKASEEDLEGFPVDAIMDSLKEAYENECIINRTLLVNALDRICLFTDGFDSNSTVCTFSGDKLTLTTKRNNTVESIKYLQPIKFDKEFSVSMDAAFLKAQLTSFPKEDIIVKFGNEDGIMLVCDNIIQIACVLDEE